MLSTRTVLLGHLALLVAVACNTGSGAHESSGIVKVDTTMVFMTGDAQSATYPQAPDSSRMLSDGSVRPDTNAPACPLATLPDTQSWIRSEVALNRTPFRSVSLRLPNGFRPEHYGARWTLQGGAPAPFPPQLTFWVGRSSGYPTSGMSGVGRQSGISECRLTVSGQA